MHKNKVTGFTIVELLIVIVVIAILAAISVVVFRGVQNRANDTVVQNDISNFAKKVKVYHAEHGVYPAGTSTGSASGAPMGMDNFPLSKNSYAVDRNNFYYCTGNISGAAVFAIGAVSKSGNRYYLSSQNNLNSYSGGWSNGATVCPGMLSGLEAGYTFSFGYLNTTGTWQAWVN